MGKKARKTRWRTLAITDDQSDSETSSTTTAPSQSTPRRKYQQDGTKSTRSSSTASENKITFNEDEYTKITTPRQDVLFKKGYLNKPRSYQTQTSTGTSTTSTGNSTGNGTPDYQSTDLEYESHFVFPNGLVVSQNGMYYLNGYESYPLVYYNVPAYYPEYSTDKSKRNSAGSLTESTSPNTEEVTSQDLSGGEASNNLSDYSGHHNVYNVIYPNYYVNGFDSAHDMKEQTPNDQPKRVKRRKRKKSSLSQTENQDSTECSGNDSDHSAVQEEPDEIQEKTNHSRINEVKADQGVATIDSTTPKKEDEPPIVDDNDDESSKTNCEEDAGAKTPIANGDDEENESINSKPSKYNLKPDAEEFVPRAYRNQEVPLSPVQLIKLPNFVPIPIVPFNGQNFSPAFMPPPGFPVNFAPPDPKAYPNYVQHVVNSPMSSPKKEEPDKENESKSINDQPKIENCDTSNTAKDAVHRSVEKDIPVEKHANNRKTIDIATIVHKLEEAAKEQEKEEIKSSNEEENNKQPQQQQQAGNNKRFRNNANYKRNYYNSLQSSPQRKNHFQNRDAINNNNSIQRGTYQKTNNNNNISKSLRESPLKQFNNKTQGHVTQTSNNHIVNGFETKETHLNLKNHQNEGKFYKRNPENYKTNWKSYQRNTNEHHQQNVHAKSVQDGAKNYSETLKSFTTDETIAKKVKVPSPNQPETTTITLNPKTTSSPIKLPNQWISVHSKKKRKNRPIEENDATLEESGEQNEQDDLFESYDVDLLVDVIPPAAQEQKLPEHEAELVEDKNENIEKDTASNGPVPVPNNSNVEIETLRVQIEEEKPKKDTELAEQIVDITLIPDLEIINTDVQESVKNNAKKSKKSSHKPLTKKVIITDVDLSLKIEEIKPPIKNKVVKKLEKITTNKTDFSDANSVKVDVVNEENVNVPESPNPVEEEKKKNKKKKKKTVKSAASMNSLSSSTTTLNNMEDSFELFTSIPGDLEEKTNDEISQELDKLIQKGMYGNLEEKIKSLNIDESNSFFKSMFTEIPLRDTNTGYTKVPDFKDILGNAGALVKPNSVSEDKNIQNVELPNQEEFFLENHGVVEILDDQSNNNAKNDIDPKLEKITIEQFQEPKTLYPITEAVKEWMCRTRETTPTVEILKSPKTIYKEFYGSVSGSDSDTETGDTELLNAQLDDEEITIFTANKEQDLLDYWEDDLKEISRTEQSNNINHEKNDNGNIEIYESTYGQNKDFLDIQRECQMKTNNANNPQQTGLPNRAVCCNVM